uniref:Uncharacterized protein n=1 Tax=Solanum tuberosum TaxID=4113 RepID=M1D4Y3_SOLTU
MYIRPKLLGLSKMMLHPCWILQKYTIFRESDTHVDIFKESEQHSIDNKMDSLNML